MMINLILNLLYLLLLSKFHHHTAFDQDPTTLTTSVEGNQCPSEYFGEGGNLGDVCLADFSIQRKNVCLLTGNGETALSV